jgi:hypothetical protein
MSRRKKASELQFQGSKKILLQTNYTIRNKPLLLISGQRINANAVIRGQAW